MVAHSTTKNPKEIETHKISLIFCCNDENIKHLLYFWGPEIVLYLPINCLKICPIVPFLNVPNRYQLHTQHFLLIADFCAD